MTKLINLSLVLSILTVTNLYAKCDMDGLKIMQKQKDLQSVEFETVVQRMTLQDTKTGSKEKRTLKFFMTSNKNKEDKSLVVFIDPKDIKGTALLNHQHNNSEDDQWLYLPGLKKVQRVSPGGKKRYFMGTDFTFADFESEQMDNYKYTCLGEKSCSGKKCYEVEALPKNSTIAKNTGYSKRVLLVRNDIFATYEIDFYDRKNKKIKTLKNSKWEKVTNTVWRPQKAEMIRGNVHKTTMEVATREVNKAIKDVVFQERYLVKEMHMR